MRNKSLPKKRITWLKMLNFCVLQWTGFRLARVYNMGEDEQTCWGILGIALPMSGWGKGGYKYL